VEKNRTPNRI